MDETVSSIRTAFAAALGANDNPTTQGRGHVSLEFHGPVTVNVVVSSNDTAETDKVLPGLKRRRSLLAALPPVNFDFDGATIGKVRIGRK